ncbi:MAG TPA: hypothetical protein DD827_08950 [Gammaproteobacteria bacterium]|jgi:hypothetical protein|nr:hypothetical protein [Gammaproteobacteria bacterium]
MTSSTQQYQPTLAKGFAKSLIGVLMLLCVSLPAWSAEFKIESVDSELRDGVYHLDARFDLQFSKAMQSALLNGVTLVIGAQIELKRPRRYWMDEDIATLEQRYSINYHLLSRQYLVTDLNTEIQRNFHSFDAAVDFLNSGRELPSINAGFLDPDLAYLAYIRVYLVRSELPLALKAKAYSLRSWKAASPWSLWQIQ